MTVIVNAFTDIPQVQVQTQWYRCLYGTLALVWLGK